MSQKLIERQEQQQQQQQRLSAQQMMFVRLLSMPIAELEEHVRAEADDNPALETYAPDDVLTASESYDTPDSSDDGGQERQEREDALDAALEGFGRDDRMPTATYSSDDDNGEADYEEMVYGDTTSFYDKIREQVGELELTDKQHDIMDYLIGSLDDDGLLRKTVDDLADELAFRWNVNATAEEVEQVLDMLQHFDPAGIGARSLQECLLIQLNRRTESHAVMLTRQLISKYFELFRRNNWQRIRQVMQLSSDDEDAVRREIRRLNPKPGAALGETEGRSIQQVTPDFIVDTSDDGEVSFSLNHGDVPELKVSASFTDMIDAYRRNPEGMSRSDKEALLYAKEKVERAQNYINAIRQRQKTLFVTMRAVIDWQRKYFRSGDESDLRPMVLKDIAAKTGLDISTVSRVANEKYAQTRWGTFPLRHFFTDSYTTSDGQELAIRRVRLALKEIIDREDPANPLSDEALTEEMKKAGLPIARRTVTKYRKLMNIPSARLRRK